MDKCIVKPVAEKLKQAFREGDLSISDLYKMTDAERKASFAKYMSDDLSSFVNARFEKAMVSGQKDALQGWVKSTFKTKENTAPYQNLKARIDKLDEMGVLNPEKSEDFLADLVAEQLGIKVTPEEVKTITEKATKLEGLAEIRTSTGSHSLDYYKAFKDMNDYIEGLTPSSGLRIATSVVGRANLLGLKSAIVNPVSTAWASGSMAIARRINAGRFIGSNSKLAQQMMKEASAIFRVTRIDVTRTDSLNPAGKLRLGESITSTKGPGKLRKATDVYSDIIFNIMQGGPDSYFSNAAFYDSLNLYADKMAAKMGYKGSELTSKAAELMIDANRIDSLTPEGAMLRKLSIADARWSTWTEQGGFGELALAVRKAVDRSTGELMLGEFGIPFVKQPANAVQRSVEATGIGAFRGFIKLPEALREARLGNPVPLLNTTRLFVESGLGLTLSLLIAYSVDPEDFIPDYSLASPKERDMVRAKNASYNSVKIGGKYISLDYFGIVAAPLVGWLYARKFGNNIHEKMLSFGQGVLGQATRTPGFGEVADALGDMIEAGQSSKNPWEVVETGVGTFLSSVIARMIPQSGTLSDIDKGTDIALRQSGRDMVSKIVNSIPFLRRTLPEKINPVTGETLTGEGLVITLLFGSRLKTAEDDPVVVEIQRLHENNVAPAISNIEYASTRIQKLREQIGDELFYEALNEFGRTYRSEVYNKINSTEYKRADDEKKRDLINSIRSKVLDRILERYGYRD
jgi:hypothetical protein